MRALVELGVQNFDLAAQHWTFELHQTSVEGLAAIHGREQAKRTFTADIRGLDRVAVFQNGKQ
jgi:hypothetical protein